MIFGSLMFDILFFLDGVISDILGVVRYLIFNFLGGVISHI